jgi:hypothetical protein
MNRGYLLDRQINNTTVVFEGMPQGEKVVVACTGDVAVAWFNDTLDDYDAAAETIEAPGGVIELCPHSKCELTTTGDVKVRVVKENR